MPKTIKKKINRSHKKNKLNKTRIQRKRRKTIKKRVLKGGKSTKKRKLRNKKITYKKRGGMWRKFKKNIGIGKKRGSVDFKPHRTEDKALESFYGDPENLIRNNIEQSPENTGLYNSGSDLGLSVEYTSNNPGQGGIMPRDDNYYESIGCDEKKINEIKKEAVKECNEKVKKLNQGFQGLEEYHNTVVSEYEAEKAELKQKLALASASAPATPSAPSGGPPPAPSGGPPPAPSGKPPNLLGVPAQTPPIMASLMGQIKKGPVGLNPVGLPSGKKSKSPLEIGGKKLGVDISTSNMFTKRKISTLKQQIEDAKYKSDIDSIIKDAETLPNSDEKNKIIADAKRKRQEILEE